MWKLKWLLSPELGPQITPTRRLAPDRRPHDSVNEQVTPREPKRRHHGHGVIRPARTDLYIVVTRPTLRSAASYSTILNSSSRSLIPLYGLKNSS